jgi:hypothetical protein
MAIQGIDGLTFPQLVTEVERGGRFVVYQYTFSVIVMTFRRPTDVFFVRAGESRTSPGTSATAISAAAGWWGIPWGPIFTIMAIVNNARGGRDVTDEVMRSLAFAAQQPVAPQQPAAPVAPAGPIPPWQVPPTA